MKIGEWVRRPQRGKWHRVESVVADDAVTSCGRRLDNEGGLERSEVMRLTRAIIGQPQLCKQCDRG